MGTNPHCNGYAKNSFWEKLRKMAKRKMVLMLMILWVLFLYNEVPCKVPGISNKSIIFILIIHYKVGTLGLGVLILEEYMSDFSCQRLIN